MARGDPGEQGYTPQVMPEDLPRKIIPRMEAGPVGPALEQLSGALEQKARADSATWAGNQLSDLRIHMMQQLESAKSSAAPGADGFTAGILKQYDQSAQNLIKTAGSNNLALQAVQPGLNTMRAQFADEAIQYEAQEGVKYRFTSAKDSTDKLATIAAQRPGQFEDLVGQAMTQIRGSNLTPDAQLQLSKYAQSTIAKSAVLARAQADPYGTMTTLLKPEDADPAIKALTPDERETLLEHSNMLLHQRVSDAERVQTLQDKQERENATSALTSLIVKSRSPGGLNVEDVLAKAPLFRHEPGALQTALDLAGGKRVETDVQQFAPRFAAAMRGEDQTQWALAHVGRDLSESDFEKFINLSDKGVPNPIALGARQIENALKPNELEMKFDTGLHGRHADAMTEYYLWAQQNPGASAPETIAKARQLTQAYSMAQSEDVRQNLPLSRFMVGNRASMDPDATAARIAQAETSGQITHQDAVQEMALNQQWRAAMERAKAVAAARAAKAAQEQ